MCLCAYVCARTFVYSHTLGMESCTPPMYHNAHNYSNPLFLQPQNDTPSFLQPSFLLSLTIAPLISTEPHNGTCTLCIMWSDVALTPHTVHRHPTLYTDTPHLTLTPYTLHQYPSLYTGTQTLYIMWPNVILTPYTVHTVARTLLPSLHCPYPCT